jgi:hypothetical protein
VPYSWSAAMTKWNSLSVRSIFTVFLCW